MKQVFKNTPRIFLRALLTLSLFLLVVTALIQLTLILAVSYLNSGKAHDEIQAYITEMMQGSGYNATFDTVSYYPTRGLTIRNLQLSDTQGVFLLADHASLNVNLAKLATHELELWGKAGTINLLHLPQGAPAPEAAAPLAPFALPDIYFKSVRISSLLVKNLILDEAIAGQALAFSPALTARADLSERVDFSALLRPAPQAKFSDFSLPASVSLAGAFDPATLLLLVDEAQISSPDYKVSGKGHVSLAQGGEADMKIDAAYPDLNALTQGNLAGAELTLQINGALANPAIDARGTARTGLLKEKGLSDIELEITSQDAVSSMQADIRIGTRYQDQPIELTGRVLHSPEQIELQDLKATAPKAEVTGQAILPMATLLPEGALRVSVSDLSHYKDLLQTDIAGALTAEAGFKPDGQSLSAGIKATLQGGRYDTLRVASLSAAASIPDIAAPWPQDAEAKIEGFAMDDTLSLKNGEVGLKRKDAEVYGLSLSGAGVATVPFSFKGTADLSDFAAGFPTARAIDLTANLNASSLTLTGEASPQTLDLKLGTRNFLAIDLPAALPDTAKDVRLSGDISLSGSLPAPVTTASLTAEGFDTGDYKGLQITADARHEAGQARLSIKGQGTGIKTLEADITAPVVFALSPFAFEAGGQTAMAGDIRAALELGALSPLFLPPTQSLSGNISATGKIAGTVTAPDINATLTLSDAAFADQEQGIEIARIAADAQLTNSLLTLKSLTATDNEDGHLSAKGQISLGAEQAGAIALTMKNFHLPKSQMANGYLDADLSLQSVAGGYAAQGVIDIAEMNITVPETFTSSIPELNIIKKKKEPSRPLSTSLSIKVNAPNQVFVRGWGLDAEFGGTIEISGDASAPQFNGALSSRRGRFEEFGKRFTLAHADLRFQGDVPPSPYLDVEATTQTGDVTASVLLKGPVTKPAISFSSSPALPQDEVLSRILFNKDSSKITPFQAIQLAQMIQRFSGKGGGGSGFDPLGQLRAATGLDDISVETDESGQTNVGVGKYLTDKVYLEVEKGKAASSGNATIQIEVTPQVNIQSKIGQESQTGGGIFWKRDY